MKIEITYNSYTYDFGLKTDDKSFNDDKSGSQCKQLIKDSINKNYSFFLFLVLKKLPSNLVRLF